MWLIFLWGAAVPFGMAMDGEIRPESWTSGLATASGLLVVVLVVMLFAPRFAGLWAMGFAAGSVVALIISPIKGYPMLDIGFALQAIGGWGLMGLSIVVNERKQDRSMRNDPIAMMQIRAIEEASNVAVRGALTARGQVHPMLTTISEMVGPGRATVEPHGPLIFTLDSSGCSHRIGREDIKSVEQVGEDDEQLPPGTLWIMLAPTFPFAITIEPIESQRGRWLALGEN